MLLEMVRTPPPIGCTRVLPAGIFPLDAGSLRGYREQYGPGLYPSTKLQMQSSLALFFQRLPAEYRARLDLAIAAATEARLDAHAHEALNVVAVLASRTSFDQAVDRYIQVMGVNGEEAQIIRTKALVALGESGAVEELLKAQQGERLDWRYATPLGAVRYVRRQLRRSAEEDLWMELSAARAEEALIRTHVKHALNFVHILEDQFPPTRAVTLYIDQLEVSSQRARSVYQRALARVAAIELPRLPNPLQR